MNETLFLCYIVVGLALVFDFTNGFHDASNSIATIVATKVLKPFHAVLWAAFWNFAAFFIFSTGVAKTVGSGLIDLHFVTLPVIVGALIGAIAWNLLTWWVKMPSSSSHALLGGYLGAALFHKYSLDGWHDLFAPVIMDGWLKTLLFIFVAPLIGYAIAFGVLGITNQVLKRLHMKGSDKSLKILQLISSAALSLNHGSNDAQKTAGVIAGALMVAGIVHSPSGDLTIPGWVVAMSYIVISLGTLTGGWRITQTLGFRLTRLRPLHGFAAETGAAFSIFVATMLHLPISTTLSTSGAVIGVGAARGRKHVKWDIVNRMAAIWLITLPSAAAFGGVGYCVINLFVRA